MRRFFSFGLMVFLLSPWAGASERRVPEFPTFVFGHIVWEDESTSQSLRELVRGYLERGIPVSGVIIDSPWETTYNSFEFDPERYPDYQKLISELKAQNLAIILWITSAINTEDPEYLSARAQGYFVKGFESYKWWKGTGGLIDYKNPEALNFWHERMKKALDLGIEGWKVDGVEGAMAVCGIKRQREYSRAYYSDFFYYSRKYTQKPIVIMARGIEEFNEHSLGLPSWTNPLHLGPDIRFAPKEISFMTWMGDQSPTWDGLRDALRDFFKNVKAGYLILGFDIFGYRSGKPDQELFIRWAQLGAFVPLMENGGVAEHKPWAYGEGIVEIYRKLAVWHEELKWYLYSLAEERYLAGKSLVEPGKGRSYLLGDAIFVIPITNPKGRASGTFPEGTWRYWYNLSQTWEGKSKVDQKFPLSEFPVYLKEGSLIPLWVKSGFGGHLVNSSFSTQDTFWILPGKGKGTRKLREPDATPATVSWNRGENELELWAEGLKREVVLLVEEVEKTPRAVYASGRLVRKIECNAMKPGEEGFCLRERKLFLKLLPEQGRLEVKIYF